MRHLRHLARSPRLLLQLLFTLMLAGLIGGAGAFGLLAARNALTGMSTARMPGLVYLLNAEGQIAQVDYYSLSAALDPDAHHRAAVELPTITNLSNAAWQNFRRYQSAKGHSTAFRVQEARITDLFNKGLGLARLSGAFNNQSMNQATSRAMLGASEALVVAPLMQSLRELANLDEASVTDDGSTAAASTEAALLFLLCVVVLTVVLVGSVQVAMGVREHRRRTITQPGADQIMLLNKHGLIRYANPSGERLLGYRPGRLERHNILQYLHPEDLGDSPLSPQRLRTMDSLGWQAEIRLRHEDGSYRWVAAAATNLLHDPVIRSILVTMSDVTTRKLWEDTLRFQARHDPLTSLPNRLLLQESLHEALDDVGNPGTVVALLLLDLDHFKEVNDTLGHQAGDSLLEQVSLRLQGTMRAGDTIGRLGGDEFAAVLPSTDLPTAIGLASRLVHRLEAPFQVADRSLVIGATIGIALSPDHGNNPEMLLKHADVAMYQARRRQVRTMIYEADADPNSLRRLDLIRDLRKAIPGGQLALHYQPQVDVVTKRVRGVEALLRWQHPVYGAIAPDQSIPLAEQAGLLDMLTDWVLHTALNQSRLWSADGRVIPVAVNISPRSVQDRTFPDRVGALLKHHDVSPKNLTLEITEDSIIADPAHARQVLARLSAQGVRISIDDFGTGYSSLASLMNLPVHELKIDKSFVIGMGDSGTSKNAAIVRSVIVMAHSLGLTVVAEGVEDPRATSVLTWLKCDSIQGYDVCRPLPVADLERWLDQARERIPEPVVCAASGRLIAAPTFRARVIGRHNGEC
jgi:diguanylate cyclase (GGDEF)-like protein/PAS domain S-box-containing protein